ncbi:MAG: DUF6572 domain-containing protein [Prosthecobacter sp.]
MAVDDPKTVDVVSVDRATSEVILDVTDHLDWSDQAVHHLVVYKTKAAKTALPLPAPDTRRKR